MSGLLPDNFRVTCGDVLFDGKSLLVARQGGAACVARAQDRLYSAGAAELRSIRCAPSAAQFGEHLQHILMKSAAARA